MYLCLADLVFTGQLPTAAEGVSSDRFCSSREIILAHPSQFYFITVLFGVSPLKTSLGERKKEKQKIKDFVSWICDNLA